MKRPDRRYTGSPEYSLEKVRVCIGLQQFQVTRTAYKDAQRVLPPGTVSVHETIREIVTGLAESGWRFAQEAEGRWVDVYRVEYEPAPLWVKLKVELTPQTKEIAVVISFHEWNDDRPI